MAEASSPLARALAANYIPPEYITLPNLQVSPTGIPYISLPEPCSEFCLTNYLASAEGVESDAKCLDEVMAIPSVRDKLALFVVGGSMNVEIATQTIREALEAPKGWCMPAIRQTADVCSTPLPRLIGRTNLSRNTHRSAGTARAKELVEQDQGKSDRGMTWNMGFWLNPEYGGKGLMTTANRYIISHYFLPHIHSFPGQLVGGYLASNKASSRLLGRLGFKPVAKSYWVYETRLAKGLPVGDRESWKSGCALWQGFNGEYPAGKKDSILSDLEDWDE